MELTEAQVKYVQEHQAKVEKGQTFEEFTEEQLKKSKLSAREFTTKYAPLAILNKSLNLNDIPDDGDWSEVKAEIKINLDKLLKSNNSEEKEVEIEKKPRDKKENKTNSEKEEVKNEVPKSGADSSTPAVEIPDKALEKAKLMPRFASTLSFSGFGVPVKVASKYTTYLESYLVPRIPNGDPDQLDFYYLYKPKKIGNFTTRTEFNIAREELFSTFDSQFPLVVNPPTTPGRRSDEMATSESSWGFNLPLILTVVHKRAEWMVRYDNERGLNENIRDKLKALYKVCLLRNEREHYQYKINKLEGKFFDVTRLLAFLKSYCQDKITRYDDYFPDKKYLKFKKIVWKPESKKYFNVLRSKIPAVRDAVYGAVAAMIEKYGIVSAVSIGEEWKKWTTRLRIDISKFTAESQIPSQLLQVNVPAMFYRIMRVLCYSKYARLEFIIPHVENYKALTLMSCMFMKAFFPIWMFKEDDIIAVDNYIFFHLCGNMTRARVSRMKNDMLSHANVLNPRNFLTEYIDVTNTLSREFVNFFRTDMTTGAGWGGGGINIVRRVPEAFQDFFSSHETLYEFPHGSEMSDDSFMYPQLLNFQAITDEMFHTNDFFNRNWITRLGKPFFDLMSNIASQITEMGRLAYVIARLLRVYSTYYPFGATTMQRWLIHDRLVNNERVLTRLVEPMELNDPAGFFLRVRSNLFDVRALPFPVIQEGLSARNWAAEICKNIKYYDTVFEAIGEKSKHEEFLKKKVSLVMAGRKITSSMDSEIEKYLLAMINKQNDFPEYTESISALDRRLVIRDLVDTKPQDFGYLTRFYYVSRANVISRGPFSKIFVYDPRVMRAEVRTIRHDELEELVLTSQFNDLMEKIDRDDSVIEFLIPVTYNLQKIGLYHEFTNQFPIGLREGNLLSYGNMDIFYQLHGDIYNKFSTEIRFPSHPRLVPHVDDLPFRYYTFNDMLSLISEQKTFTSNLEFMNMKDRIRRRLVADI